MNHDGTNNWNTEVGKTYRVVIEDCCVKGEFTSKLIASDDSDPDNPFGVKIFENGVKIDKCMGCDFIEVV